MNKKIFFILTMCFYLVACSAAPIAPAASPLAGCKKQGPWFCKGTAQAPTINLNTTAGKLKAKPYCAKVVPGAKIIFRLYPAGNQAINAVEIVPKNPAHTWLAGKNNADQDLIIIPVPNGIDPKDKYYFGVITPTDCIDPRVKVEN